MHAFNNADEILEKTEVVNRFLSYVRFDTQSEEASTTCPSTAKQLALGEQLVGELKALGLDGATLDENGYVLAELPGTAPGTIGLCAHLDTAPAFSGTNVQPTLHENYDGSPIHLRNGVVIDPAENPAMLDCTGSTIITSDGTTLLGADDKAGIAAIMSMLDLLKRESGIEYPTVHVCFTPDEEVGRGADRFPLEKFKTPVAFTIDGGYPGEMSTETFSANKATLTFTGVAVHPGTAKNKMVNALTYLGKLLARLPMAETPECTEGRQGFYHPTDVSGDAAECTLELIIRDFDTKVVEERGRRLMGMAESLVAEEPDLKVEVQIKQQYRNMYDDLAKHPEIEAKLTRAIEMTDLAVRNDPIRGGTDGSRLTAMGLPTPNVFTGGGNFHGPQEWISTRGLGLCTCTLLNLVQLYAGEE